MTRKLTGKVALVTGGSRSIGATIAKRLAAKTVQTFGRLEDLVLVALGLALWRITEQPAASVPGSVYGLERRSE
ncbi:MAG TPA: hypothetical protein VLA99_02185 [Nitrospiraceae bacterium]|nr:hypothetical protein [Nitrospiraceae bacterium]